MKRLIYWFLWRSGLCALMRTVTRRRLKIVLYHGVSPESGHLFNYRRKFIHPASFEQHIAFFAEHYNLLPLDEANARLRTGTLPLRALAITFDDGYRNNYEYAFPVLKKYNAPATVFLATDFVFENQPLWVDRLEYANEHGSGSPEEKRKHDDTLRTKLKQLPNNERLERLAAIETERGVKLTHADDERYAPLTKDMIAEMSGSRITFGAHTMSHPILRQLSPSEIRNEIVGSLGVLNAHVKTSSRIFAYPNGQHEDWTSEVEAILAESGFAGALTTIPGTNSRTTPPFELRRFSMDGTGDFATFIATESGAKSVVQSLSSLWKK